jgi:rhomboid family GlyGly-CTERM serine protease
LALSLLILSALGDNARALLRYDRAGLEAGQWWRLLSCHLVHLNWPHCLMNVAALLLIGFLFGIEYSALLWTSIATGGALAVSGGLWFFHPELQWYVGASGALHTLLAAGGLAAALRRRREGYIVLVLLALKLAYEHWSGPLPMHSAAMRAQVIVDAHLYGAVAGFAIAAVFLAVARYNPRSH